MGRRPGSSKMEFIENQKSRNSTLKRRKECLMRKIEELSTLCDINASMVIFAPDQDAPAVWPPNDPVKLRRMIDLFRGKKAQDDEKDGATACDEKAQIVKEFDVYLLKKAQLVRDRINQLKSESQRETKEEADHQEDRLGPTPTTIDFGILSPN